MNETHATTSTLVTGRADVAIARPDHWFENGFIAYRRSFRHHTKERLLISTMRARWNVGDQEGCPRRW